MADVATAADSLVTLARNHGWVDRRHPGVVWFERGTEYAHLGVDSAGRVLSAYAGVRGRPSRHWVAGRRAELGGSQVDCGRELADHLAAERYRFSD